MRPRLHLTRAVIDVEANDRLGAELELAQTPVPTADTKLSRARIYLKLGDKDLARADVDAAIGQKPSEEAFLLRAELNGGAAADADVEAALKL